MAGREGAATGRPAITGATRLAGVIGWPLRHSLSPTILNAAFEATGLDWTYLAFEVPPDRGPEAIEAFRTLGVGGWSVTMPHKAAAAAAVDACTAVAQALGAVNCVYWDGDRVMGDNTDGAGFLDGLRLDHGVEVAGMRCVVVGAGGAGRALVRALAEAGAAEVAVVNRTPERAVEAAALAGEVGRVGGPGDVGRAELVVNATSVGMGEPAATGALPLDPGLLRAGQVVADIVYHPLLTPLLAEARARRAVAVDGLGMLIHQAAHAFRRWTGHEPPLAEMSGAAHAELERRALRGSRNTRIDGDPPHDAT